MQVEKFTTRLHYCTTASRNGTFEVCDSLSQKEVMAAPCSSAARLISCGMLDELIECRPPWPFWLQTLIFPWVPNAVLLWFSDVPDAPQYLVLSEHKSKSVKLKWIPGDDHNSSTSGTAKEEHKNVTSWFLHLSYSFITFISIQLTYFKTCNINLLMPYPDMN